MTNYTFNIWKGDIKYSLVSGGLFYTLLNKIGIIRTGQKGLLLRSLIFSLLSWLPLVILSLFDGTFLGEYGKLGVVQDFLLHIRMLIVVPYLIWIEKIIDPAFNGFMNSTRRLIANGDEEKFKTIVNLTDRLSNSWIPEIVALIVIYGIMIINWKGSAVLNSRWTIQDGASNINPTGIYYILVSMPIYQLLFARWFWRWIIWAITAIKFSKMDLSVEATHADQMAGLGYLTMVPTTFCMMLLSTSAVFSAMIGENIIYQSETLNDYISYIITYVLTAPVVIFIPLAAFFPLLLKTKARAITDLGALVQFHNQLFKEKWLSGKIPDDESILPSMDNSSMADLNGSYQQSVQGMKLLPLNRLTLIASSLVLILPFLPLVFTVYSVSGLFSKLLEILTG